MAITAYDQPAQAQFMQTYVPMPFEEMVQAGQMKQQRWDQNELLRQQAETALGDIPALREVQLPGGQSLEVGDYKHVQKVTEDYSNRIEDLVSSVDDKSSPEYRAKITGIITDLRKDMSPQGTLGRAAANVEKYKQLKERIDESELGAKTHRAIGVTSQLTDFAKKSQEDITDLSAGAPILKDININKRLNETMSKINDRIQRNPELRREFAGKITQYGYAEGISEGRAASIAQDLILEDPEIVTDIQARLMEQGYTGDELQEQTNQTISRMSQTMADVYAGGSRNVSWSTDQEYMRNLKKSDELEDQVFATELNLPATSAKPIESGEELDATMSMREAKIGESRIENIRFLKDQYDIPDEYVDVDDQGYIQLKESVTTTDPETGEEIEQPLDLNMDISHDVFKANQEIRQAKENFEDLKVLKNKALDYAEIDKKYLDRAVERAREKAVSRVSTSVPTSSGINYKSQEGREAEIKTETEKILNQDPKLRKFNEYLKSGKGNVQNVNVVHTPEMNDFMERTFTLSIDERGLEWADTEKGTGDLDKSDREDIDTSEYPPKFRGFFYDQDSGNMKALYNVYDKKGNSSTVKTEIPKGASRYLHETGAFDRFESLVFNDLYNQIDGIENRRASGTGTLTLPSGEIDENGMPTNPLEIQYMGRGSDGRWRAAVPVEGEDNPKVLVFDRAGDVVTGLAAAIRKSHENAINKDNE